MQGAVDDLHCLDISPDNFLPSGTNTPLTEVSSSSDKPRIVHSSTDSPISLNAKTELGESDSDLEPDELLPTWLSAKSKLYRSSPDLAVGRSAKGRKSKGKKLMPLRDMNTLSPLQGKLLRKIAKIERDVLFDQYEAERQWDDRSKLLALELSQRRNSEVEYRRRDASTDHSISPNGEEIATMQSDTSSVTSSADSQDADEDNLLGELFQTLPQSVTDTTTGVTSMTVDGQEGNRIIIRDFGKWTGLSPRRILEETCRARYDRV